MQKYNRLFLSSMWTVSLFLLTANQSLAGLLETGFEASYEVSHNGIYLGDSVRNLENKDQQSRVYRSHTSPKGLVKAFVSDIIDETSHISRHRSDLRPTEYQYHQHSGKKEQKFTIHFDWQAKTITNTYRQKTYPLTAGTHDLLSFQIQLMLDMQAGKKQVTYTIADKKRVDDYHLQRTGTDTIETPMKTFTATKLVSNKIRDKMQFIIWCAPELGYLPVKVMKIEEDGDESEMLIKSLKLK